MEEQKSFGIAKRSVWEAWKKIRANQGAAGVDGVSIAQFESRLPDNLYKVWNRMASGSYFPSPVKRVYIPKGSGGERPLGIPTVGDRVAQMVAKQFLEPLVEPAFHPDSYGYRPGKSALDAVGQARQRCWRSDWVIDLDIKGFFDNIDHGLLMRALRKHTDCRWVLLYVERWLKAPVIEEDGVEHSRDRGTPQGGVISPLLANLFLHYVLDAWMVKYFPDIPFERYADDAVYHCKTKAQAQLIKRKLEERLQQCGLQAHPEKTQIVYCKDSNRGGAHEHIAFDFLGYQFRPRKAKVTDGVLFVSFSPGCSPKALKRMGQILRSWRLNRRVEKSLEELACFYSAVIRGWIQYYGAYNKTALRPLLQRINRYLVRWAKRKYKRFRGHRRRATYWLRRIARRQPYLFPHWRNGVTP